MKKTFLKSLSGRHIKGFSNKGPESLGLQTALRIYAGFESRVSHVFQNSVSRLLFARWACSVMAARKVRYDV